MFAGTGKGLTRLTVVTLCVLTLAGFVSANELGYKFDGDGDYLSDTSLSSNISGDMTLEVWTKFNGAVSGQQTVAALYATNGTLQLCINSDGQFMAPDGGGAAAMYGPSGQNDGWWHQVVITRSSSTSQYALYVDGVFQEDHWGSMGYTYTAVYVGANSGPTSYYCGSVDEVRLYNRALSLSEVQRNYEEALPFVTDGLTSRWELNGNGNDSAGSNNLTLSGNPTTVAGRVLTRRALAFNGTDQYLHDTLASSISGDFTLEAWLRVEAAPGSWKRFMAINGTNGSIELCANGNYIALDDSGGVSSSISGSAVLGDYRWHHAAVTRSNSSGTPVYSLYVDGSLAGTSGGTTYAYTAAYIGTAPGKSYFPGQIDEARLYSAALTSTQIENNYKGHDGVVTDGLVSEWKIDLNTEDSCGDNDLAAVNSPEWVAGRDGRFAYDFSGSGQYISATLGNSVTGDFTLEGWLRVTSTPPVWQRAMSISGANGAIEVCATVGNCIALDNSGGVSSAIVSGAVLNDGRWHHAAVTRSNASGTPLYSLYVDGALIGTSGGTAYSYTNAYVASAPGKYPLDGQVDEMRLYNRALRDFEVFRSYSDAQPVIHEGLISWWPIDSDAKDVVASANGTVAGSPVWTPGRGFKASEDPVRAATVLNNMVTELRRVDEAISGSAKQYTFLNPRKGWVFFSSTSEMNMDGDDSVEVSISTNPSDTVITHEQGKERTLEAVRYLPAGNYTATVTFAGGAYLHHLLIRSIPDVMLNEICDNPQAITNYGPYDIAFLSDNGILRNLTTAVAHGNPESYRSTWWAQKKKWITEQPVLPTPPPDPITANSYYNQWKIPFYDPYEDDWDGVMVDELLTFNATQTDAVELMVNDDQVEGGKLFCPYVGAPTSTDAVEAMRLVMDSGNRAAWELYLTEMPDQATNATAVLDSFFRRPMQKYWRKEIPYSPGYIVATLGNFLSAPPANYASLPGVDMKVWMDMQYNMLSTDPLFFGLYGVTEYNTAYADEEVFRWASRLWRHYCIEGNTEMLSDVYGYEYALDHVSNPDFDSGETSWSVYDAEGNSAYVTDVTSYKYNELQGRTWLSSTEPGNHVLCMTRSSIAPNHISQQITGLTAGRLYSLKVIGGDYQELVNGVSDSDSLLLTIDLDDVDSVEDSFHQASFASGLISGTPFSSSPYYMDMWRYIFRASGSTATVTISDWQDAQTPGGSIGQTTMLNFIELQPYFSSATLTVYSKPYSDVSTTISPVDMHGAGSGAGDLTREYDMYRSVTLTAPATANGLDFARWENVDGTTLSTNRIVTVDTTTDKTVISVYE